VRLDADKVKNLSHQNGLGLHQLLRLAGVSKTAYYSLLRRDSVVPASVLRLSSELGVPPSAILEEIPQEEVITRRRMLDLANLQEQLPEADRDNLWQALILLERPVEERLNLSLTRGRQFNFHS